MASPVKCLVQCLAHFNYSINGGHSHHRRTGQSAICCQRILNCFNFCISCKYSFPPLCHTFHSDCCHCCCQCSHRCPLFISNHLLLSLGFHLKTWCCTSLTNQSPLLLASWADWWQRARSNHLSLVGSICLFLGSQRFLILPSYASVYCAYTIPDTVSTSRMARWLYHGHPRLHS